MQKERILQSMTIPNTKLQKGLDAKALGDKHNYTINTRKYDNMILSVVE